MAGRISQKSLLSGLSLLTRTTQNKAHVVSALSSRVCKYNKDETYTVLVLEGRLTDISIQSELKCISIQSEPACLQAGDGDKT